MEDLAIKGVNMLKYSLPVQGNTWLIGKVNRTQQPGDIPTDNFVAFTGKFYNE